MTSPPKRPVPPILDETGPRAIGVGLGLEGFRPSSPSKENIDPTLLSPYTDAFPRGPPSSRSTMASSSSPAKSFQSAYSPMSSLYQSTPEQGGTPTPPLEARSNPFDFKPAVMSKTPVTKSSVGQRRGHKYKHSSVSHQIFLEPPPRVPVSLPTSLPVPTFRECRRSMSKEQNTRFWWSICHALVAGYTLWTAGGSLTLTALSHLIFFDSLGAMLCVVVDVLGNFEVWRRSSIRHPFGLERAEVLAGFAMSVLLLFMGLDLTSHTLQHLLENVGDHKPHVEHSHPETLGGGGSGGGGGGGGSSPPRAAAAAVLAILATVVSALVLNNHARVGKVMRMAYLSSLPSILSNPSHFLTLTCSVVVLFLVLVPGIGSGEDDGPSSSAAAAAAAVEAVPSNDAMSWLDPALSATVAAAMCGIGGALAHRLGLMLLMSCSVSGDKVDEVLRAVRSDPLVRDVDEAKFWQVHYGLCMANFKLSVREGGPGSASSDVERLRERVSSLVRNRLAGGYGRGGHKWEVSMQVRLDK